MLIPVIKSVTSYLKGIRAKTMKLEAVNCMQKSTEKKTILSGGLQYRFSITSCLIKGKGLQTSSSALIVNSMLDFLNSHL